MWKIRYIRWPYAFFTGINSHNCPTVQLSVCGWVYLSSLSLRVCTVCCDNTLFQFSFQCALSYNIPNHLYCDNLLPGDWFCWFCSGGPVWHVGKITYGKWYVFFHPYSTVIEVYLRFKKYLTHVCKLCK